MAGHPPSQAASASAGGGLLERDEELAVLDGLLRGGLVGDPRLGLVEGPAGIGKSRLLAQARERAAGAGLGVLSARGSDLEREFSFGVVRQLFEPLLTDPDRRLRWLADLAAPAARVFAPPDDGAGPGDVSYGILHGLFWLTANIAADGPLLIAVDDLHWCDRASLRFLAYLAPRLEGIPVVVVAGLRTSDPHAETALLEEIAQDPTALTVRPRPLSASASAEFVRRHLGTAVAEPFWRACHQATGGNPLLLGELLKTLQAERVRPDAAHVKLVRDIGPRAVSRTVLLRLSRLGGDTVAVARAVAVLGDGASVPLVTALAGLDQSDVADATDALVRAEILAPGTPPGFVHPLVRDAVYLDLRPSERERGHARAATLLVDAGASAELVAAHLVLVPSRTEPGAGAVFRAAGLAAARRGDEETAVSYLRRALEVADAAAPRPELLFELGMAEAGTDAAASARHMSEAYDLLTDPLQRAMAARVLARMLLFTGTADEAVDVARQAAAELPAELVGPRQGFEAFELCAVAFGADVPDAASRLARVRADSLIDGVGAKMLRAVAAFDWALTGGCAEDCAALALDALADGELVVEDPGFGTVIAGATLGLADREEAVEVWAAATSEAERVGSLRTVCMVNIWRGFTWLQRGELAPAEATLEEAAEQIRTLETNGIGMAYIAAFLARAQIDRGDLASARRTLALAPADRPPSDGEALLRQSTIELALAEARWADALAAAGEYRRRARGGDNPAWAPWRTLTARALDGLDRRDEALPMLKDELALARHWGAPGPHGRTLRLLGTRAGSDGIAALREAVEVTERSPAQLEHARSLVALGSAQRRAGRRSEAREPLRRGLDAAARCGAEALAEDARAELLATGARLGHRPLTGPGSLTPSERRVADLAAQGRRNHEIARALCVTSKTVEVHLTSVYRKLGISTRAALPAALCAPVGSAEPVV